MRVCAPYGKWYGGVFVVGVYTHTHSQERNNMRVHEHNDGVDDDDDDDDGCDMHSARAFLVYTGARCSAAP